MQFINTPQALRSSMIELAESYERMAKYNPQQRKERQRTETEAAKYLACARAVRLAVDLVDIHIRTLELLETDDGSIAALDSLVAQKEDE